MPIKKVDYNGYDLRLANEMNKQLALLLDEYPEIQNIKYVGIAQNHNKEVYEWKVREVFKQLRSMPENDRFSDAVLLARAMKRVARPQELPPDTYAQAANKSWGDYEGISWNRHYASDYDKIAEEKRLDVLSKFHPVGTENPTSVITHEFGHMVHYYLRDHAKDALDEHVTPILKEFLSKGKSWVKDNLSIYAADNEYEMVAEAFSEYYHNKNPRNVAVTIINAIKKVFAILRGV